MLFGHMKQIINIIENDFESLLANKNLPFLFWEEKFSSSNVSIPEAKFDFENFELTISSFSTFREIKIDDIQRLRVLNYLNENSSSFDYWTEKILRYCEVRYRVLLEREKANNRSKSEIISLFVQIRSLFLEIYLQRKDLRFLNTALKLNDLNWLNNAVNNSKKVDLTVLQFGNQYLLESLLLDLENE